MTTDAAPVPDASRPEEEAESLSLRARRRQFAGSISNALSLVVLTSPIVLWLPLANSGDANGSAAPVATVPAQASHRSDSLIATPTAFPGSAILTRTIPIIEVKVRRVAKTQPEAPTASAPEIPPPSAAAPPPVPAPAAPTDVQAPPPPVPPPQWTEAEVSAALRACVSTLAPIKAEVETRPPLKENTCGMPAPIAIASIGGDRVTIQPPALVSCGVASALHAWLVKVAQPAAREMFGTTIVRLSGTSGYACRNRNGAATGPISEHAFGNAIDISGFVLADGRTIDVLKTWGPTARDLKLQGSAGAPEVAHAPVKRAAVREASALDPSRQHLGGPKADPKTEPAAGPLAVAPETTFLKRIHAGACGLFGTVLGPEANEEHRNHLHFDIKARKHKSICE